MEVPVIALHVSTNGSLIWLAWSFDPIAWFVVPLFAALYSRGLSRSQGSRRRNHPRWRPACYYAGLATVFLALASPLDHLSGEFFSAHMAQHFLLIAVAAPLVLLGAPMVPVLRGVPVRIRRSLVIPILRQKPVRKVLFVLTRPVLTWSLYVSALFLLHMPAAYDASLRNETLHLLQHGVFFGTAVIWWWNVIDPIPLRPNLSYLARVPYVFITTVPIFVLGSFLTFSPSAWYDYYLELPTRAQFTALEDQQIGGIIMWVPGSLVLMITLLVVLLAVVRTEERSQRQREMSIRVP